MEKFLPFRYSVDTTFFRLLPPIQEPMHFYAGKSRVTMAKCFVCDWKKPFDLGDLRLKPLRAKRKPFVPRDKSWQAPLVNDDPVLEGRDVVPEPVDLTHALADVWKQFKDRREDRWERVSRLLASRPGPYVKRNPAEYWFNLTMEKIDWAERDDFFERHRNRRVRHVERLIQNTRVKGFGVPITFETRGAGWGSVYFVVKTEVIYREDDAPSASMTPGQKGPLFFTGNSVPTDLSDRDILRRLREAAAKLLLHELDECFFDAKGERVFDPHDRRRWLGDAITPIPV